MDDEQRERLGLLLERALSLPRDDRARFIADATGEDAALREELTSLVDASAPSSTFFDGLAERVGPLLASSVPGDLTPSHADLLHAGDLVSHYRILARIGGGMGVVYRAVDLQLGRPVALKFLPPALAADERARARLCSEARALSTLDHPNIGIVHELGEAQPGGLFIALGWCEGGTLKETIARGPLPIPQAVSLATQVASALSAAHAAGIIHRDVKPSNILCSPQGVAKLVDFGIARITDAGPTREGWTPGTIAYMSPEQTRGESVDPRSDIWSIGVVLYEMLAGRRPFEGEHDATVVHAIRNDEPDGLTKLRLDVPPTLERIVLTCLAKERSARYAADDLVAALTKFDADHRQHPAPLPAFAPRRILPTAQQPTTVEGSRPGTRRATWETGPSGGFRTGRKLASAVGTLLVLTAAAGLFAWTRQQPPRAVATSLSAEESALVAVLPFRVSGTDLEGWEEGVVDLLSASLDGVAGIRAVDGGTVLSRWRNELGDAANVDLASALRIGGSTGARYVIEGSAVSIDSDVVRLVARIHDLASARRLGSVQIEGSLSSPYALVDDLGLQLLRILFGGEVADLPKVDLAAATTRSTEALHAYLEGERHYRRGRWTDAAAAFLRAVEIDSTFALAHHRVDLALGWAPGDDQLLQRRHREIARSLADRLPERERLLVNGTYRMIRSPSDPTIFENPIEEAVQLYPNDAEAWYLLGEAYIHYPFIKHPSEIEAAFARAVQLDSAFAPYRIHYIEYAILRGDSVEATRRIADYRAMTDPQEPRLRGLELGMRLWTGDSLALPVILDSLLALPASQFPDLGPPPLEPHFLRRQETLLRSALRASSTSVGAPVNLPRAQLLRELTRNLANQGRLVEAIELLDDPALLGTDERRCAMAELTFLYVSVSETTLRAGMGDPGSIQGSEGDAFCGALLATALGDRAAFERGRERLLATGQGSLARLAEAYWVWKRDGEAESAAHLLLSTDGLFSAHYWTFWMGEIYRELGRFESAEEAYRASQHPIAPFANYTVTWYRLARVYETLGEARQARDAWEPVIGAWEHGDAEVQPRVAEARARLASLR